MMLASVSFPLSASQEVIAIEQIDAPDRNRNTSAIYWTEIPISCSFPSSLIVSLM